jgi:hypothetical protein
MTRKASNGDRIYARAYISTLRNAKIAARSHLAWRLYVSSWIRCREEGNDGEVKPGWLIDLVPGESKRVKGVLVPNGALNAAVAELVACGLWDPEPDGWTVHDYLEYQDGAEKIAAAKAKAKVASDARWN